MINIILLALGLSADAATVSIGIGCAKPKLEMKKSLLVCSSFGISQGVMPIIGALLGKLFYSTISHYSRFIIFAILGIIGVKTIIEGIKKDDSCKVCPDIDIRYVFPLAIATSIDALAIGFVLPMMQLNIILSCVIIGVITFIACWISLKIGKIIGCKVKNYSEIIGGLLLVTIAIVSLFKV